MLGFKPCTLKTEKEFNTPFEIGDCAAFDRMGASKGSERIVVALDSPGMDEERIVVVLDSAGMAEEEFAGMFAGIALA